MIILDESAFLKGYLLYVHWTLGNLAFLINNRISRPRITEFLSRSCQTTSRGTFVVLADLVVKTAQTFHASNQFGRHSDFNVHVRIPDDPESELLRAQQNRVSNSFNAESRKRGCDLFSLQGESLLHELFTL